MVSLKKLTSLDDIEAFQKKFNSILGYSSIPLSYYSMGDCYVLERNGDYLAGFCLVKGFEHLRSIRQLPIEVREDVKKRWPVLVDFTGYFIQPKTPKVFSFIFTIYLVLVCAFYSCNYFVYSYLVSEVGLGKYYGKGLPTRVHTGKPLHLEGHHDVMDDEHVEILTKLGVARIFLYRTKRLFFKNRKTTYSR
jgi:hypothetical protein